MLTSIKVNNFKALQNFSLDLHPHTVLVGLPSSGKTTILQSLEFAASLWCNKVEDWLTCNGLFESQLTHKLVVA